MRAPSRTSKKNIHYRLWISTELEQHDLQNSHTKKYKKTVESHRKRSSSVDVVSRYGNRRSTRQSSRGRRFFNSTGICDAYSRTIAAIGSRCTPLSLSVSIAATRSRHRSTQIDLSPLIDPLVAQHSLHSHVKDERTLHMARKSLQLYKCQIENTGC